MEKNFRLHEILTSLRAGEDLVLETLENQRGTQVPHTSLYFSRRGKWVREELTCWSASSLELGTCQCVSHRPYQSQEISRSEVLAEIRAYIERERRDDESRQAEITWLDQAIKGTEAATT